MSDALENTVKYVQTQEGIVPVKVGHMNSSVGLIIPTTTTTTTIIIIIIIIIKPTCSLN